MEEAIITILPTVPLDPLNVSYYYSDGIGPAGMLEGLDRLQKLNAIHEDDPKPFIVESTQSRP